MPISDPAGYGSGHFTVVYRNFIKPACEQAGFRAIRADDVTETNYIAIDILRQIMDADMAVCDLSARNPNVLYELGLRHASRKPVTLLKDDKTDEIFDISGIRRLQYDASLRIDTVQSAIAQLAESIRTTYALREDDQSSNSLMSLLEKRPARIPDQPQADRPSTPSTTNAFIRGRVAHWETNQERGVIHVDDESYYVNAGFFVGAPRIAVGEIVYFVPRPKPTPNQNPLATVVLIEGQFATGVVRYVNTNRNFAFATVTDRWNNSQNIYVQLPLDSSLNITEGAKIRFTIDKNAEGVCGIEPEYDAYDETNNAMHPSRGQALS